MIRHLLKPTTFVAALALVGGSVLVTAPSASAAPAPGAFAVSSAGIPSSITLPKKNKSKSYNFNVSLSGTPADTGYTDSNGDGATVKYNVWDSNFRGIQVKRTSSVAKSSTFLPRTSKPYGELKIGTNAGFKFTVDYYTIPGKYTIKIPVTQSIRAYPAAEAVTTKWITKTVTVKANKSYSKSRTSFYAPSWRTGTVAKFTLTAPAYQKGGKVTLYVKKGKKKYTKVTSTKLKKKGSYSTTAKFKAKNLRPGNKILVKIGKVKYSGGYSLKAVKIKRIY